MKEFNLEEYLIDPLKKVVTRDGRAVRIICTDAKNEEPIIALVYNKNRDEENVYTYNRDGYFYNNNDSCLDLFFATVKRKGWINIYKLDYETFLGNIYQSEEEAKKIKSQDNYIDTIKIEWEE